MTPTPFPWPPPRPRTPTPWGYRGTDYGTTDPGDGPMVGILGALARPWEELAEDDETEVGDG